MRQDKIIHIAFSGIIALLTITILSIQILNIPQYQKSGADKILEKISFDLSSGGIKPETLQNTPKNELFIVLLKDDSGQLSPLFYDNRYFDSNNSDFTALYQKLKSRVITYKREINGYSFVTWINKYNPSYIALYIILPILFSLLIYIIGTVLIIWLFGSYDKEELYKALSDEEDDFYSHDNNMDFIKKADDETPTLTGKTDAADEKEIEVKVKDEDDEINIPEEQDEKSPEVEKEEIIVENKNESLLEEDYKDLWGKNFKISSDFFENFPFEKVYDKLIFNTTPNEYIVECLKIASTYFKWNSSRIYISQQDIFVDAESRQTLNHEDIIITADGTQKGGCFIPLFPYNKNKIFGYFYFNWEKEESFFISDILYFLKFMFSHDAKYIFMNFRENQQIKDKINSLLQTDKTLFAGFIKVDDLENHKLDYTEKEITALNHSIFNSLQKSLPNIQLFNIFPLYYGIFGSKITKEELKIKLGQWMNSEDNHSYNISASKGNIAVTFSGGVNFSKNDTTKLNRFLYEAEDALKNAVQNGGDQLIIK